MSSIFPQQYMDTEDIRMMRAVLLRAGYCTSKIASDIKLDREAAAYLILSTAMSARGMGK